MRPALVVLLNRSGFPAIAPFVPTTGFMYVVVFFVVGALLWRRARATGLSTTHASNLWILGGVSAIVGARLFFLIVNGGLFQLPVRSWFDLAGTASWGVYLGVALAIGIYGASRRLTPWPWLDLFASVQPIGEVIGRLGCWLAGDDFGRVTDVPWAIRFPAGSFAWNAHVARGAIPPDAAWSLPVHPEQFYLMANALILFVVISAVWRRTRDRPGLTLATYLVLYGASRFGWEFFRDPAAGGAITGLSSSQWMCMVYVAAGGVLLFVHRRQEQAPRA